MAFVPVRGSSRGRTGLRIRRLRAEGRRTHAAPRDLGCGAEPRSGRTRSRRDGPVVVRMGRRKRSPLRFRERRARNLVFHGRSRARWRRPGFRPVTLTSSACTDARGDSSRPSKCPAHLAVIFLRSLTWRRSPSTRILLCGSPGVGFVLSSSLAARHPAGVRERQAGQRGRQPVAVPPRARSRARLSRRR